VPAAPVRGEGGGRKSETPSAAWGNALRRVDDRPSTPFDYQVGRPCSAEVEQLESLEAALWTAVRTFKENVLLARQLATRERTRGDAGAAARFEEQAEQAGRYGDVIQRYVMDIAAPHPGPRPRPAPSPDAGSLPPGTGGCDA
jgi:hypothetical protein